MDKTIYEKTLKHYGEDKQILKIAEACNELSVKVFHLRDNKVSLGQVAEKIAEVEIMCQQGRLIVGDDIVDNEKRMKLKQLEYNIQREKFGKILNETKKI